MPENNYERLIRILLPEKNAKGQEWSRFDYRDIAQIVKNFDGGFSGYDEASVFRALLVNSRSASIGDRSRVEIQHD